MVSLDNPKSVNLIFPSSEISKLSGLMSLHMIYICYGINNNRQKKFLSYFPRILASCFMKTKQTVWFIHYKRWWLGQQTLQAFLSQDLKVRYQWIKQQLLFYRELYEKKNQTNKLEKFLLLQPHLWIIPWLWRYFSAKTTCYQQTQSNWKSDFRKN